MSTPNIPDLSGKKIGEYEIVKRVGLGGMGAVYEGRQPLIGKRVAVKVLLPSLSHETELVERFLAEARSVNEIRHRGIVDIFSFGQLEDGSHYFVMEYLEGQPFDALIKQRSPMPIGEALAWVEEMLDALDAAHSAGIIHRDIKPSNIFLVNTGRGRPYVKVLDFGIAKLGVLQGEATPQTRASVILGTPDYISPEQARGRPISPQTDIYAMGCVLFEMVTGERLFKSDNSLQTMWAHVEDTPPVPSSIRADIPPELDELILWAIEKQPENRPPSAGEYRDQLALLRATIAPSGQTPAPITGGRGSGRLAPLKTPAPISQRTKVARSPASETRMQPLTATSATGNKVAKLPDTRATPQHEVTEPQHDVTTDPERAAVPREGKSSSKLPLIFGLAVTVLVLAVAVFMLGPSKETPKPPPPVVDEPLKKEPVEVKTTPPPEPVKVETPPTPVKVETPPEPVKVETPPEPVKVETPVKVEPKKVGITQDKLIARLRKIETSLASKEAASGQRDNVVHQFIEQAKKQIRAANTDADRKEAWQMLGDIESQLK